MNFEYFYTAQATGNIEIEDVGNCAIEANDDNGFYCYLIVRTIMGTTNIFNYGPIQQDIDLFPDKVNCSFKRFNFDVRKINREIESFLNNPKTIITQAIEIEPKEALSKCRDIIEYMKNPSLY